MLIPCVPKPAEEEQKREEVQEDQQDFPPPPSSPTAADSPTAELFRGKGIQYLQQEETPRAVSRSWGVGEGRGRILTHFLCGGELHILGGMNYKLQITEEPRRNRTCSPDEEPTLLLTSCKTEFQTQQANN